MQFNVEYRHLFRIILDDFLIFEERKFLIFERKTTSKYVREEDMQILGKNRVRLFSRSIKS